MNEPTPSLRMNGWQALGATGIMIGVGILLIPIKMPLAEYLGFQSSMLVDYVLLMLITIGIVVSVWKVRFAPREFELTIRHLKAIPLVIVVTFALMAGVIAPVIDLIPYPEAVQDFFREIVENTGVPLFIMMVIAAPLLEELLFRGVILKGLLNRYKPRTALIISSILFGIAHLNPWQFVSAVVLGMFIGWTYYKTRSLALPIIIHVTANLASYVSLSFTDSETMFDVRLVDFYGGLTNLTLVVAGCLVLLAAGFYVLKRQFYVDPLAPPSIVNPQEFS